MKTTIFCLMAWFCITFQSFTENTESEDIKSIGKIELDSLYEHSSILKLFGKPQEITETEIEDVGICTTYSYPKLSMEFNEGGLTSMTVDSVGIKINNKLGIGDHIDGIKQFNTLETQKITDQGNNTVNYIIYFGMEEWIVFRTRNNIIESFSYAILLI